MSAQAQHSFFDVDVDADDGQHLAQMEQHGERVRHQPCNFARLSFRTFMDRIDELEPMFENVPLPADLTITTFMQFYLNINHTLVMMTTDQGTHENGTLTWEDNVAILHQFLLTTLIREELQGDRITQDRADIVRMCLLMQYITSGDTADVKSGYHIVHIMDGVDIKYRSLIAQLFTMVQPATRFVFENHDTSNAWSLHIQTIVEANGFPITVVPYVPEPAPQPVQAQASGFATPPPTPAGMPSTPKKRKMNGDE